MNDNGNEQVAKRLVPSSDLDYNLMTTDAVWGSPYISQGLMDRLGTKLTKTDTTGEVTGTPGEKYVEKKSLWDVLSFFTRDMRLANLNFFYGEVSFCQHYIELAGDMLQVGMSASFVTSLSRAATVLELSQSKGGFLRRRMNTFTSESVTEQEPKKKGLFGTTKKAER